MKVSIVIPCYNEKDTIEKIVEAVCNAPLKSREIIVVDDCSKDGTQTLLRERLSSMVDRIIYHPVNQGKGAALRSGFAAATGDFILVQDADLEYSPEDYPLLLEPLMSGKADVVLGSRFMGGRPHRVLFFWHMVGNKFLTLLSNMLTNINLTDVETGYKAFKAPLIKSIRIEEDGLELSRKLSPNSPAQAAEFTKWGSRTADAPTRRARRSTGKMVSGRFMRSSNTTLSVARYERSCCAKRSGGSVNINPPLNEEREGWRFSKSAEPIAESWGPAALERKARANP